jgi:asparagine synthase (glutamine-hydrolysing)
MCGICGKISPNINGIDEKIMRSMIAVLRHRGPDDEGIYLNSQSKFSVGLGHCRLSIIDLSKQAQQPISNENRTIWMVCNGEIYNFQDLKRDLEEKGHSFKSKTDNEVIIHLYEEEGIDCVKSLRGMFALCIWDKNKQRLFLARDRLGQKPLNYIINNGELIFASEIKSILQDPGIAKKVNLNALHHYLTYQYIPHPLTMFKGIKKLLPAHILIWEKGKVKIERYWDLKFSPKIKLTEEEYKERLLDLLTEAVKIRLISDVPLGVFLSGGIDSSSVVAIMSKIFRQPIKTFSVGFKESSFNELEYIHKVAKIFATKHHEYIIKPNILEILPELIWYFNEPFADSSCIPTYYLSKMARQEVKVVLNGDGGDECFGGYERYVANKIADIYCTIPKFFRDKLSSIVMRLPESTTKKDFAKRLKRFLSAGDLTPEKRHIFWMSIFDNESKQNLYSKDLRNRLKDINSCDYLLDIFRESEIEDFIDKTLLVDTMSYLPNDLLVKIDISSMANSLEVRSPFLDHKLMEFAASLSPNLKLKGLTTKYILKKTLGKVLPKQILYRKKAGFGVPIGSWFRNELKDYPYEILLDARSIKRGYFKKESIERLLAEHISGLFDHGQRIWALINLELWHQMFID